MIQVYTTDEQMAKLKRMAEQDGLSISQYVRMKLFGETPKLRDRTIIDRIKDGNSLIHIARVHGMTRQAIQFRLKKLKQRLGVKADNASFVKNYYDQILKII